MEPSESVGSDIQTRQSAKKIASLEMAANSRLCRYRFGFLIGATYREPLRPLRMRSVVIAWLAEKGIVALTPTHPHIDTLQAVWAPTSTDLSCFHWGGCRLWADVR